MSHPQHTYPHWTSQEADRAFAAAARARRRAALVARLRRFRRAQFDQHFRPTPLTRCRWQRIWMTMHRGITLPPISAVQVRYGYAIGDGHHRVSVAEARGALSITAVVAV